MEFAVTERRACPVCMAQRTTVLFSTYDDRYGQPDDFTVLECVECGTCYLREAIEAGDIARLYENYYGYSPTGPVATGPRRSSMARRLGCYLRRSPAGSWYQEWYRRWTAQRDVVWGVRAGDRVLEIGCGYGWLAKGVERKGAHWVGLEVDSKACQAVSAQGFDCVCGTIETADLPPASFDVVIGSQVIEHALDPLAFASRCARLLKPRGRLLLATPNARSRYRRAYGQEWIHWFVPYHQVLFTAASLGELARRCGLQVRRLWTETPTSWAVIQEDYERPARGERGLWRDRKRPRRFQPEWRSLRLRLLDCVAGDGDNLVAELVKDDTGA